MATERQDLDITNSPELSRLANELQTTGRTRMQKRANEDVAVLVPVARQPHTPAPTTPALQAVLANEPKDSPVARTAGMLHTDQPFPGYAEEREVAAIASAQEAIAMPKSAAKPVR
ncbi:MAG: hypothetical protein ACR2PL_20875 [Dehalococcoidia bacterium]